MVVITGPLDSFTTLRLGDRGTCGFEGGAAAACARASGVSARPVTSAAALMTALRMRNDRRSTPAGTSVGSMSRWLSASSGFIVAPRFARSSAAHEVDRHSCVHGGWALLLGRKLAVRCASRYCPQGQAR